MTYSLPEKALEQHIAAVGKTGSGKTYMAKGIVEIMLDQGRRVCVLDPTGAWWGLRSSADGTRPGFPVVVFGGEHADVPITERSAAALAEVIAGNRLSCVIDLSDFLMGEKHRFVTAFAQTLHRHNRLPLQLVIDEADEFAPQNPLPETRRMLHEIDRLVRRGRIKGFRLMFITQRPAVLHKNILTQANTLIAMRLTGPQDRKAIEEWIKGQADPEQGKVVIASLPRLKQGEGWVWSPEYDVLERKKFPTIQTFDSSRAPEDGDEANEPVALADVDIAEIIEKLAVPEDDEPAVKAAKPDRAALDRARAQGHAEAAEKYENRIQQLEQFIRETAAAGSSLVKNGKNTDAPVMPEAQKTTTREPQQRQTTAAHTGMTAASARLLAILARHAPARFTWGQLGTLAGLKARGGHFNASRKALRDRGFVEEDGALVWASAAGMEEAGEVPPAPATVQEKVAIWREALSPLSAQILGLLVDSRDWWDKTEIAEHLGKQPRGGHWNSGISMLRNNGLIEENGIEIRAAPDLLTEPKAIQEVRER